MSSADTTIPELQVTRYVAPLREGGSLPAIAEAEDGQLYVLKFRGAGQGVKALISELIGGEIARILEFNVPRLVFCQLDEAFGRTEPDEEIQDLLRLSTGRNLGLAYLSGAITFDIALHKPDNMLASQIVWLDAFLMNVDRTVRNPNMLQWKQQLWLIDHGAALYFHHNWPQREKYLLNPFEQISNHVMFPYAAEMDMIDHLHKELLKPEMLHSIVDKIPDDWLQWGGEEHTPGSIKEFYKKFLVTRLENSACFTKVVKDGR